MTARSLCYRNNFTDHFSVFSTFFPFSAALTGKQKEISSLTRNTRWGNEILSDYFPPHQTLYLSGGRKIGGYRFPTPPQLAPHLQEKNIAKSLVDVVLQPLSPIVWRRESGPDVEARWFGDVVSRSKKVITDTDHSFMLHPICLIARLTQFFLIFFYFFFL